MRLVFFVKNLTGWSYQTAEWLIIGIIAAIVLIIGLAGWATFYRRRKARRAAQAAAQAAAPLPLNRRFENALLILNVASNGNGKEFYAAHHLWLLLKKPQTVRALKLEDPHEDLDEMLITFLRFEQERAAHGPGMSRASQKLASALDDYRGSRTAAKNGKGSKGTPAAA